MIDRYRNRKVLRNNADEYSKIFEEKGLKYINQYATPSFKYFTREQLAKINYLEHVWSAGDRLYKLADKYMGDHRNWWLILRFNKIRNETDIKAGDVIRIPKNIDEIALLLES